MAFFVPLYYFAGEMLVLIVKLKYKVQHCKRLFEFLETIAVTMDSTALIAMAHGWPQRRSSV